MNDSYGYGQSKESISTLIFEQIVSCQQNFELQWCYEHNISKYLMIKSSRNVGISIKIDN
jgi:hypothetical protein